MNTTYICVTLRRWAGKDAWVASKNREGVWREVHAYDAIDLEQCLGELLGKLMPGIRTIDGFWESWSSATQPTLTPAFALGGRVSAQNKILGCLNGLPSAYSLRADSPDKAVAFFAATMLSRDASERDSWLSRSLIVEDAGSWQSLIQRETTPMLLVPMFDHKDAVGVAVVRGHRVFPPLHQNAADGTPALPRPMREAMEDALRDMGIAGDRGSNLATLARRSLQAFRRKLAISPSLQVPEWARPANAIALLLLLLLPSTSDHSAHEDGEDDWSVLAEIAGTDVSLVGRAGQEHQRGVPVLRELARAEAVHHGGDRARIKEQIRGRCGSYVSVSVGIGTNQFLAKTAAGLKKPDGLERIDHANLREVYSRLKLTDLCGINSRYEARLNMHGIHTPLQFLDADPHFLHHSVFHSVVGQYWALILRGYEHQRYERPDRKSFGNSHSIRERTRDPAANLSILCKLCDMAGRRMRREGFSTRTVSLFLLYPDGTHFAYRHTSDRALYTTAEIFRVATLCSNRQKETLAIHKIGIHLSSIEPGSHEQLDLFEDRHVRSRKTMDAVDKINDRYGEQVVYIGSMHGAKGRIDDSISFGSPEDVKSFYAEESSFPSVETETFSAGEIDAEVALLIGSNLDALPCLFHQGLPQ